MLMNCGDAELATMEMSKSISRGCAMAGSTYAGKTSYKTFLLRSGEKVAAGRMRGGEESNLSD